MAWKLYSISSGHCSMDDFDLDAEEIPAVLQAMQAVFPGRLTFGGQAGMGLSLTGVDILVDGSPLTVGWDNWSGVFIMARDDAGDAIYKRAERLLELDKIRSVRQKFWRTLCWMMWVKSL